MSDNSSMPTPDDGNYRFLDHPVEEPEKPTRRAGAMIGRVLSLLLALIVGAVAGSVITYAITKDDHATMSQPAAVTNPTTAPTEPTQVEQIVQPPAKTTPPMTPSDYYLSEERRAPLREAVDRIGRDWLSKLLSGEIPSTTRGWSKTAPAPYNGYGAIVSSNTRPKPGETFIQVNVKFINGEVDTNVGPLGIFIIDKDGRMAGLDGETTLNGYEGTPILDTPNAFGWHLDLTEKLGSMNMAILGGGIGASFLPDSALPIDRTQQYMIMLSDPEHPSDDYREANIGDIMSADAQVLSFLNDHEVTGSDW